MPYKPRLLGISPLQGPKSYSSANPNLQFALGAFIGLWHDEYGHRPGFIGTSGFTEGTWRRTGRDVRQWAYLKFYLESICIFNFIT